MTTSAPLSKHPSRMEKIFLRSTPFKVFEPIISFIAVFVIYLRLMMRSERLQKHGSHYTDISVEIAHVL